MGIDCGGEVGGRETYADEEGAQESCRQPQLVPVGDQDSAQHRGCVAGKRKLQRDREEVMPEGRTGREGERDLEKPEHGV